MLACTYVAWCLQRPGGDVRFPAAGVTDVVSRHTEPGSSTGAVDDGAISPAPG